MKELVAELRAEQQALDEVVAPLSDNEWYYATPAAGWNIHDSIAHLYFFDLVSVRLITEEAKTIYEAIGDMTEVMDATNRVKAFLGLRPSELLAVWRETRIKMDDLLEACDPKARIPWVQAMSARSFATARMHETWAHGVDIFDTLGIQPTDTDRLRHVAFLAWTARPYCYMINNLEMPATPLRIELTLPSGAPWAQGPEDAENIIRGTASDFCRVAVRRRHWLDTDLEVIGDEARRYAEIAQSYAGPSGSGRKPSGKRTA